MFPKAKLHLIPATGTYPHGFLANGLYSGIKKKQSNDIAVVLSPNHVCQASAVFTTNKFAAAPVQISRSVIQNAVLGVVVNSGCANACTGEQGLKDAHEMSNHLGSIPSLVMSTGVIGQKLQMGKIREGLARAFVGANETHLNWLEAAKGIMTTDTFPKLMSREFVTSTVHPNMATMLSAVFTDCKISKKMLDTAVREAAARSFNAISIDGDTSTNDTFAVFANGAADMASIQDGVEYVQFEKNLTGFATDLAKLIVRDGEGATKFVEVKVTGATTFEDAKQVASTIVKSPLVKTAIYGKDANWGRIVCAVGYSGVDLDPTKVNLHFGVLDGSKSLHLFKDGEPHNIDEAVASEILEMEDLLIHVDLGMGTESMSMFTCDLSHEYISINADYRS